jgi:DNA-directed RNA polymerase specialized sigma24 family protein
MPGEPPYVAEVEGFLAERGDHLLRAAIVLRYWEELSEAETAEVMGCSVGTVKSATSRGLHRLRELSQIDYTPQGRRRK